MHTAPRHLMAFAFLAVGLLGAGHLLSDGVVNARGHHAAALIGTWRLVEFWDRASLTSPFVHPYGQRPTGYFTYDATGHVSIQIMRGPESFRVDTARGEQWFETATHEELRRAVESYRAYFGTYVVDETRRSVVHKVEGDSRGLYTATDQRRRYRLVGDTLFIGNGTTSHRLLVRVR